MPKGPQGREKGVFYEQARNRLPALKGIVNISGDFVAEHFEELVNLVKAEERRATEKNPHEHLIKVEKVDGGIKIETTSDALALRIGRLLNKSYKGRTDFKFRYSDKYVIVDWVR